MPVPPKDCQSLLELTVTLLADRLEMQADALDPAQSLMDLGVESVEAVFLCGALEERLGIGIDPVLVFEAASVAAFAEAVWQLCPPAQEHAS